MSMYTILFLTSVWVAIATASPTAIPSYKYCKSQTSTYFGMECNGLWSLDENGDDKVTELELRIGMRAYYPDPEYFRAYFLFRDLNQDGVFDKSDEPLVFDRMDTDKDGDITLNEYFMEYHRMRGNIPLIIMSQLDYVQHKTDTVKDLTQSDLNNILAYMRHESDGSVNYKSFTHTYITKFTMSSEETDYYFGWFDHNSDGLITPSEMGVLFNPNDKNGDGLLQLNEVMEIAQLPY